MSKVLYIKANIKPEGQSRTFHVADSFIEEYKALNPEAEITTIERDEKLYKEALNNIKKAHMEDRIDIIFDDIFKKELLNKQQNKVFNRISLFPIRLYIFFRLIRNKFTSFKIKI